MKRNRRNAGFTMMETMIVVGIIAVLLAFGLLGITQYRKGMRRVEYDAISKEILVAAQNHLSMADSQNLIEQKTKCGTKEASSDESDQIYYIVVAGGDAQADDTDSVLSLMLPYGAVNDEVRSEGSYVIRYDLENALIMDVFYSEEHTFTESEYTDLLRFTEVDDQKERKSYGSDKKVIGYYGGAEAADIARGAELLDPDIWVHNEERLTVTVTNPNYANSKAEIELIVIGQDASGKEIKKILLLSSGVETQEVVLDDITEAGKHFSQIFEKFAPGCEITIQAVCFNNAELTNIAYSTKKETNSLFAADNDGTIEIASLRHLQNLAQNVSGFTPNSSIKIEQTSDLSWADFKEETGSENIYNQAGKCENPGSFVPITLPEGASLEYNGNDNHVRDLTIKAKNEAGLFGELNNSQIKNLVLENFDVESSDGNAGTLAATLSYCDVSNVLAYNTTEDDSDLCVTAPHYAGGLIGQVTGGEAGNSVKNSAAAVYVVSTDKDYAAGGLIGNATKMSILMCYSGGHTAEGQYTKEYRKNGDYAANDEVPVNVVSKKGTAGGLLGVTDSVTATCCYSTCSVAGVVSGGFAGALNGGSLSNSYCVGRAMYIDTDSKDVVGGFLGTFSGTTLTSNRYLSDVSDNARAVASTEVTDAQVVGISRSDTSQTDFNLDYDEQLPAYPYDETLISAAIETYYFPTVSQLAEAAGRSTDNLADFLKEQVGDWQIALLEEIEPIVVNADKLYVKLEIPDPDDSCTFTMSVTGDASKASKILVLDYNAKKKTASLRKDGNVSSDKTTWKTENKFADTAVSVSEDGKYVEVVLDDITTSGLHFHQLCETLYAGEYVDVRAGVGEGTWAEIKDFDAVETNSLFADRLETEEKNYLCFYIATIRHLENLDPVISSVAKVSSKNAEGSLPSTTGGFKTKLRNNLTWAEEGEKTFYTKIYNQSGAYVENAFVGIYNSQITQLNGDNYTISGLPVVGATAEFLGSGALGTGNAGLFRYCSTNLTVTQLKLSDCNFTTDSGYAGAVIAQVYKGSKNAVKLTYVLAEAGPDCSVTTSSSEYAAGGLIGIYSCVNDGEHSLTIKQCGSSMLVRSGNVAGGLVGAVKATNLTISYSYVGGHTVNGSYETTESGDYNIASTGNGAVGGIVGSIDTDATSIQLYKLACAASVANADGTAAAGGLIGSSQSNIVMYNAYTVAPVYHVKTTDGTGAAGALFGTVQTVDTQNNGDITYLVEVYSENTNDDEPIPSEVKTEAYASATLADGTTLTAAHYYDGDTMPAARKKTTYLSVASHNYDTALDGAEYPYYNWSNEMNFRDETVETTSTSKSYYGDWPLIDDGFAAGDTNSGSSSVGIVTVTFKVSLDGTTQNYYTGWNTETLSVHDTDSLMATQCLEKGQAGSVILPEVRLIDNYDFKGWYYDANGTTKFVDKDALTGELSAEKTAKDITLYAVYNKAGDSINHVIKFYYADPTAETQTWTQHGVTQIVVNNGKANVLAAPTFSGYRFTGWYSAKTGGTKYSDSEFETVTKSITAYAHYEEIEYYHIQVNFVYETDGKLCTFGLEPYIIEAEKGKTFNKKIQLPNPSSSMQLSKALKGSVQLAANLLDKTNRTLQIETTEATQYYVVYTGTTEKATYTVKYTYSNTATDGSMAFSKGSTYTVTEKINGTANQMTTVTAESKAGFTAEKVDNKYIKSDNSTVVTVTYLRNQYALVYAQSAVYTTTKNSDMLYYGETLASYLTVANTGLEFGSTVGALEVNSWNKTYITDGKAYTGTTMPAQNLLATPNLSGQANYRVLYWQQNADDDKYTLKETETKSGTIGSTTSVSVSDSKYTYYHLSEDHPVVQTTVKQDGSSVVNVYYDRNIYHLYFSKSDDDEDWISKLSDVFGTSYQIAQAATLSEAEFLVCLSTDRYFGQKLVDWKYRYVSYASELTYYYDGKSNYYIQSGNQYKYYGETVYEMVTATNLTAEQKALMTTKGYYGYKSLLYSTSGTYDYYYDGTDGYKKTTTNKLNGKTVYIYEKDSDVTKKVSADVQTSGFLKEEEGLSSKVGYVITARYGKNVQDLWPTNKAGMTAWYVENNTSLYQSFVISMPGQDTFFNYFESSSSNTVSENFYLQNLEDDSFTKTYVSKFRISDGLFGFIGGAYSTVEDYPRYEGFYLNAHDSSDAARINEEWGDDTAIYVKGNNSGTIGQSASNNANWDRYYIRRKYSIQFYKQEDIDNTFSTASDIKYQTPKETLKSKISSATKPYQDSTQYEFAGWYLDPECSDDAAVMTYDSLTNTTTWYDENLPESMPAANFKLYAKRILKAVTVQFNTNKPSDASGTVIMSGKTSIKMHQQKTLESVGVTTGTGLTAAYTPTLDGYTFVGWYRDADGLVPFVLTDVIYGNTTLYAKWTNSKTKVTIHYCEATLDGGSLAVNKIADDVTTTVTTNQIYTAQAKEIEGYYAQEPEQSIFIEADGNDVEITFYYTKVKTEPWTYTVKYYARYWDEESGESYDVLISSEKATANYQYEVVEFEMPDGYAPSYRLADGTEDTVYVNHETPGVNVAEFYIEPDIPAAYTLPDVVYQYKDSEYKTPTVLIAGKKTSTILKMPDDTSYSAEYEILSYTDMNGKKHTESISKILNAGVYEVKAKLYVTVEGKKILIWDSKEDSGTSSYVRVEPRKVVLRSLSTTLEGSKCYYESLTAQGTAKEAGEGFWKDGSVYYKTDLFKKYFDIQFTAYAFRRTSGTAANSFIYQLKDNDGDGTITMDDDTGYYLNNYVIGKQYGILTVK